MLTFNLNEEETNRLHVYGFLLIDDYIIYYNADRDVYFVAKLVKERYEINLNVEDRDL